MNQNLIYSPLKPFKNAFLGLLILCFCFAYSDFVKSAAPLDINIATVEQLTSVMNGVGRTKAQAIVDYRSQHGEFKKVDELIFVKGIGPALLEKNRELLSIGAGEPFETELVEELPR